MGECDETDVDVASQPGLHRICHGSADEMQVLELIYTVGMVHTVSFLVNGLGLENEEFGARFSGFDAGA